MPYCNRCHGVHEEPASRCPNQFIASKTVSGGGDKKQPISEEPITPEQFWEGRDTRKKCKPETQYMREWRNRNRERYNAYQREYMRNYRARKNAEATEIHGGLQHTERPQEDEG